MKAHANFTSKFPNTVFSFRNMLKESKFGTFEPV
jgi:hypothetical protein